MFLYIWEGGCAVVMLNLTGFFKILFSNRHCEVVMLKVTYCALFYTG